MAEKVKTCGINKEKGYLYYLNIHGDVYRKTIDKRSEKVLDTNILRESGYLYFIDREGDVSRAPMVRKEYINVERS
tara:strand:+ start:6632 stop:6859 length:228 start_codon:yes stop_codon:yes gene_type:complete